LGRGLVAMLMITSPAAMVAGRSVFLLRIET